VEEVTEYAQSLPNVVVARNYSYMCSDPGQLLIKNDIKEHGLNRVVVASCSPRMHEPTFRKALPGGGVKPLLPGDGQYQGAGLLGTRRSEAATAKAKTLSPQL